MWFLQSLQETEHFLFTFLTKYFKATFSTNKIHIFFQLFYMRWIGAFNFTKILVVHVEFDGLRRNSPALLYSHMLFVAER